MATSTAAPKAASRYRTAPVPSTKMPKGIKYIVGNEAAERFSYYGMKAILVIFMTQYLMDSGGNYDVMGEAEAKSWYHMFNSAVYFIPLFGAILADAFFGKYKTILSLSIVYCLGHLALALFETRFGLALGLTLIAIGSGGIKPCVSAHVGDQFGKTNAHLLERVFQWFYFAINFGSFISTLLTPVLLAEFGPGLAFGVPGLLMMVATIVFWMGRNVFVHIPPKGMGFVKETFSREGLAAVGRLALVFLCIAPFWALFDQTGSAWVLQATKMDLSFMGIVWLESQIQAINPILVLAFIPLTAFVIYPAINKVFPLTPLRKISIGLFLTVPAFLVSAWIEGQIAEGVYVNIGWQLLAYAIITMAEIFVSITCLEFAYTQSPKKMKSLVMGLFLMSISVGNMFTAGVNVFIQDEDVIAENMKAADTMVVPVDESMHLSLVCTAGDDSVASARSVEVAVPIRKPEAASDDADAPAAEITSFTAHVKDDPAIVSGSSLPVAPGTPVVVSWETANTDVCELSFQDAPVAASGTIDVVRDAPITYVLKCTAPNGGDKAEARVEINATEGVATRLFTVTPATLPPPGGTATVTWDVLRAESCTLSKRTVSLKAESYYFFFAMVMLATAFIFIFVAIWFKPRTYIQDEVLVDDDASPETT